MVLAASYIPQVALSFSVLICLVVCVSVCLLECLFVYRSMCVPVLAILLSACLFVC